MNAWRIHVKIISESRIEFPAPTKIGENQLKKIIKFKAAVKFNFKTKNIYIQQSYFCSIYG
jgi:hypothetical protein